MNKGEKWLARAMLPMVVSGLALGWLAVRPCEPVAQASTEQTVLQMPEQTIYGETVPEVDVESLPRVPTKGVAHTAAKPAICNEQNPAYHCDWMSHPSQSSVGQFIAVCDCSTQ